MSDITICFVLNMIERKFGMAKNVCVTFDEGILERLNALSRKDLPNRSKLIMQLLEEWLNSTFPPQIEIGETINLDDAYWDNATVVSDVAPVCSPEPILSLTGE